MLALSACLAAQDLPQFKKALPARAEICRMGWGKFQTWVMSNLSDWNEANVDRMAEHYRDLLDEASAAEAGKLTGPEALQLEAAVKAVTAWFYQRCRCGGYYKGGSIYAHMAPRLEAELADVKHQAVTAWKEDPGVGPGNRWPEGYAAMAEKKLPDDKEFQRLGKEEASLLQEACKQVRKLPNAGRYRLQEFMLRLGESLEPNSRI